MAVRSVRPQEDEEQMIEATYIDHMGSDLSVVNAARVSFGKKSDWEYGGIAQEVLSQRDTKLIHYLARHRHTSPFGHAFASFHIKAPVFVARQLVKHKFLRWNEISRRYVDDEPEFYMPAVWRGRSADKKQGSSEEEIEHMHYTCEHTGKKLKTKIWRQLDHYQTHHVHDMYSGLLKAGVCPEQARMVLPQSTMTEWYWSGSLDAFADMCNLRCKPDTQYETRLVAQQIDREMMKLFPVSWDALTEDQDDE